MSKPQNGFVSRVLNRPRGPSGSNLSHLLQHLDVRPLGVAETPSKRSDQIVRGPKIIAHASFYPPRVTP